MSNQTTTEFVEVKTNGLIGEPLDWAVAVAEKVEFLFYDSPRGEKRFSPSTDFSQGGLIIFREGISWHCGNKTNWHAYAYGSFENISGPTPLIAAMRCYVASKLGDAVKIPKVLIA